MKLTFPMKTFKEYYLELKGKEVEISKVVDLFEHQIYKRILGPNGSYREDRGNTNTLTQKHSHIYAKPNGSGGQLYSVNIDGSGHDGSTGVQLSKSHAEFFRSKGYRIPLDNILESIDVKQLGEGQYSLLILTDD